MTDFYSFTCGHRSMRSPWGRQPDKSLDGLCHDCRLSRIGEVIQFIRHGAPPTSGMSRNHREGTAEEGVSVYEIVKEEIQYCGWYFDIANRPQYRGTGRIVGWGSDGEPLVSVLTIKKIKKKTTHH